MNMNEPKQRLQILIGLGAAAIIIFFAAVQQLLPKVIPPPPLPVRSGGALAPLPPDLKVISGRVTEKTDQGMTVEWAVPLSTVNLGDMRKETKHITWTAQTTFDRVQIGSGVAVPQTARAADIQAGNTVQVFTVETVQDHYELTAVQVRILVPPGTR